MGFRSPHHGQPIVGEHGTDQAAAQFVETLGWEVPNFAVFAPLIPTVGATDVGDGKPNATIDAGIAAAADGATIDCYASAGQAAYQDRGNIDVTDKRLLIRQIDSSVQFGGTTAIRVKGGAVRPSRVTLDGINWDETLANGALAEDTIPAVAGNHFLGMIRCRVVNNSNTLSIIFTRFGRADFLAESCIFIDKATAVVPMFGNAVGAITSVVFRNCMFDSSATGGLAIVAGASFLPSVFNCIGTAGGGNQVFDDGLGGSHNAITSTTTPTMPNTIENINPAVEFDPVSYKHIGSTQQAIRGGGDGEQISPGRLDFQGENIARGLAPRGPFAGQPPPQRGMAYYNLLTLEYLYYDGFDFRPFATVGADRVPTELLGTGDTAISVLIARQISRFDLGTDGSGIYFRNLDLQTAGAKNGMRIALILTITRDPTDTAIIVVRSDTGPFQSTIAAVTVTNGAATVFLVRVSAFFDGAAWVLESLETVPTALDLL